MSGTNCYLCVELHKGLGAGDSPHSCRRRTFCLCGWAGPALLRNCCAGTGVFLHKEVSRVKVAIADEFVKRAVEGVGSGGGRDGDLCAGSLAIFGSIGIGHHVEFADGVDAEELPTGAAGGVVNDRGSGVFDAVQQEEIFLGAAARDGEHIADGGVGGADASGAAVGVIDDARVEGEEFVVAAAVEGEILDLVLAYEAGGLFGEERRSRAWCVSSTLTACWSSPIWRVKSTLICWPRTSVMPVLVWGEKPVRSSGGLVLPDGRGGGGVAAVGVGDDAAGGSGFEVVEGDGGRGEGGSGGVADGAGDGGFVLRG